MNDFLQSIRGNYKDKRVPKTRRNYDSSNFNTTPNYQNQGNYQSTRSGNIKIPPTARGTASHIHIHPEESQPSYSSQSYPSQIDPFDIMLDILDAFTKNQEMLINVQEKRVLAEERKAIALEEIAEYLRVITMPTFRDSFSLKKSDNQHEHIRSDIEDESGVNDDFNDDSDTIPEEAQKKNEMGNTKEVESIAIEGEVVDDDEMNSQCLDNIGSKKADEDSQDVEYSLKATSEELLDNVVNKEIKNDKDSDKNSDKNTKNIDESVKVIRRKRVENKDELDSPIDEEFAGGFRASHFDESKTDKIDDEAILYNNEDIAGESLASIDSESDSENSVAIGGNTYLSQSPSQSQDGLLSREEVLEIINSMRLKGKTFDEVAQHLITLGQPTFSGRGVWHAQTIHRICTRNDNKK